MSASLLPRRLARMMLPERRSCADEALRWRLRSPPGLAPAAPAEQLEPPSFAKGPRLTDTAVAALFSRDLARTRKFYRYFGFEPVAGEPGPDDSWLRLKRGEV